MTDIRSTASMLDVRGRKIQLLQGGSGPPLLYLHSAGGETEWLPFHSELAQNFTVYLPAHPGFATSTGLDEIDNVNDLAWHTIDLLDALGLDRVPIVGFSLGAWIGTELAILRPARVTKLVLVNAAGLRIPEAPMSDLFIDDFDELRKLLFFNPDDPSVDLALPRTLDDPRILYWLRAREATARVGWNPYLHDPKLLGQLRRVECPTLVLWGRHDRLIPLAHGEAYARGIPGARLEVFDECGHMLPFEKPAEFARRTTEFVRG